MSTATMRATSIRIDTLFQELIAEHPEIRTWPTRRQVDEIMANHICAYRRHELVTWLSDHKKSVPMLAHPMRLRRLVCEHLLGWHE